MPDETDRTATVLSQSIELALTHQPDAKNKYGSGRIRPERVAFYYLPDRINAHLWGVWVREDGEVTDAPVDQLYRHDDDWPGWLRELAAAHDPRTASGGMAADTDQTALRDRIRRVLAQIDGFDFDTLEPHDYQIQATAILAALLPAATTHTDRAHVLRDFLWRLEQSAGDAAAEKFLDDNPELRRVAAETPGEAKPWLSDSARIGRALIWSWTDIGKGAFGEGYRAAQEEARALLGGQRGTDATPTKEA